MHKHERLAQLIGQGIPQKEACAVVGVSAAYFNRLKDTQEFIDYLRIYVNSDKIEDPAHKEKALAVLEHTDEMAIAEDRWLALENQVIQKAMDSLPLADLKDVNKTLDIVSKRRASNKHADAAMRAAANGPGHQVTLVTLALPDYQREAIIAEDAAIVRTNQGEIIEAGGRALAPMSTDSVLDLLAAADPASTVEVTADDL